MTTETTPGALGSNAELGLVERLRQMSRRGHWPLLGDEAADEIERLKAELAAKDARIDAIIRGNRQREAELRSYIR